MHILPPRHRTRFYRGNLHGHCTHSDGSFSAEKVVQAYKNLRYDFTCLSDHFGIHASYMNPTVCNTMDLNSPSFLTIPSAELHCLGKKYVQDKIWHILANGLPLDFPVGDETQSVEEMIDLAVDAGAFVSIAHPEWYTTTMDEMKLLKKAHAVEIYNHSCHVETGRGGGTMTLDYFLQEGDQKLIIATDDSHFHFPDAGGGWVMVAAEELSQKSILNALKQGQYYSSTGCDFLSLCYDEKQGKLIIESSPVDHIAIVGPGSFSKYKHGKNMTGAHFNISMGRMPWLRAVLIRDDGSMAWSNTFHI